VTLPQWTPGPGYTPLSLKQIQIEFGCEIFGPPTAVSLYPTVLSFLPATSVTIDETTNRVVTFTYNFSNRNSRTIYWKLVNLTTSAADYDGATSGSLTADSGTFTVTAKTDVTTEGPEGFRIDLFLDPNGTSFYNSGAYTITDTSLDPLISPTPTPTPTPTPPPTFSYYLEVTGNAVAEYGKPISVSITGAPSEGVVYKYLAPTIENLYFDYNPDVAYAYTSNNNGLTKEQYAQRHWENEGRSELRLSPAQLTSLAPPADGTVMLNSSGSKTFDITDGVPFLGRTTPYSFQFNGTKTVNTQFYSVKVNSGVRLIVTGEAKRQYTEPIYVSIYGAPYDQVEYIGATSGNVVLDDMGTIVFNINSSTPLTPGTHNWVFDGTLTANREYYSVTIESYALSIVGPNTVYTGDTNKVTIITAVTGAPNETVTYTGPTNGEIRLDATGQASGDITSGGEIMPGTYTWTGDGSRTPANATYTVTVRKINEVIVPNPSPYLHRISEPIRLSVSGGVPSSSFTMSWIGPSALSGSTRYSLNTNGSWAADAQYYSEAGLYTYTFVFDGSKNTRTHVIDVRNYELKVTPINFTVPASSAYDAEQPITVLIEGAPGEIVTVSRPYWSSLRDVYGANRTWSSLFLKKDVHRGYALKEFYEGQSGSTWDVYPTSGGFPTRTVTLDSSGKKEFNLNGDGAINVVAQASDYSWTRDGSNTFIAINGNRIAYGYGRGHTMAVLNPVTLAVESIATYDTYGGTHVALETALTNVATGKVVILTSFDAINITPALRSILVSSYGSTRTEAFVGARVGIGRKGHTFIGIKGGTSPVEDLQSGVIATSKFFVATANTNLNGLTHLMKYNLDAFYGTGVPFYFDEARDKWDLDKIDLQSPNVIRLWPSRELYKFVPYRFDFKGNKTTNAVSTTLPVQQKNYSPQVEINDTASVSDGPVFSVQTGTYDSPSDVRLKSNITRIGTHYLGFGIYEYDIFDRREQGVLAQEVQTILPQAVTCGPDGYLRVRYDLIGHQRTVISKH